MSPALYSSLPYAAFQFLEQTVFSLTLWVFRLLLCLKSLLLTHPLPSPNPRSGFSSIQLGSQTIPFSAGPTTPLFSVTVLRSRSIAAGFSSPPFVNCELSEGRTLSVHPDTNITPGVWLPHDKMSVKTSSHDCDLCLKWSLGCPSSQ